MKKLFGIVFVFALLAVFAPKANALQCGNNPIIDPDTLAVIGNNIMHCDGGNPTLIGMVWGLTGGQTPTVKAGTTVTDLGGWTDICPAFYSSWMCYDISKTDYHSNQMRALVNDLQVKGILNQFPTLQGWIGK